MQLRQAEGQGDDVWVTLTLEIMVLGQPKAIAMILLLELTHIIVA